MPSPPPPPGAKIKSPKKQEWGGTGFQGAGVGGNRPPGSRSGEAPPRFCPFDDPTQAQQALRSAIDTGLLVWSLNPALEEQYKGEDDGGIILLEHLRKRMDRDPDAQLEGVCSQPRFLAAVYEKLGIPGLSKIPLARGDETEARATVIRCIYVELAEEARVEEVER